MIFLFDSQCDCYNKSKASFQCEHSQLRIVRLFIFYWNFMISSVK